MSDDIIKIVEIQETDFGEKAVLDSPYESRHYIKHLPWKTYKEEVEKHGSLKEKAEWRGVNTKTSDLIEVFDSMEEFGFSDDFSTHVSWDSDALGEGEGAWTIDLDALDEASNYWEYVGYSVTVDDSVNGANI